jgi:hypothetical protein
MNNADLALLFADLIILVLCALYLAIYVVGLTNKWEAFLILLLILSGYSFASMFLLWGCLNLKAGSPISPLSGFQSISYWGIAIGLLFVGPLVYFLAYFSKYIRLVISKDPKKGGFYYFLLGDKLVDRFKLYFLILALAISTILNIMEFWQFF